MRVAIVGAGIVGVSTAYELAADGHEVTVFERRGSVAAETSFANAGVVAPGYVTPWAAPGMPAKVMRQWFSRHAALRLHPTLDPATLAWLWRFWRSCTPASWQANRTRMLRLALYSRTRLHELSDALGLDYERAQGYLVLLREPRDLAQARPGLKLLAELGLRFHLVDAEQCRRIEPDLNPEARLHAGIHLPDDEVGNCRQFAHMLRQEAQKLGAEFHFNTEVQSLRPGVRPELVTLELEHSESRLAAYDADTVHEGPAATEPMPAGPRTQAFDAIVVCAAIGSRKLLAAAGLRLPLLAVHGYSLTAPLRHHRNHPDHGPRAGLMDERFKVAITRLGSRVRVAGSAEIGGSPGRHHRAAIDTLYKVLHDWFPGAASLEQAQRWKGARPMLPDGPPLLGASGLPGVWLNLGHGSSGWALAAGSARVVADAIGGRSAAIDTEGLGRDRLR